MKAKNKVVIRFLLNLTTGFRKNTSKITSLSLNGILSAVPYPFPAAGYPFPQRCTSIIS
jgi:hypothetical protein